MTRKLVPAQLGLTWASLFFAVLVVGFAAGTCIWEVRSEAKWHIKSFGEGIIFGTWALFLIVWTVPCLVVSRRAWTTKWFNCMITDAVWLGLSVCFGIADVAVWGGHKQRMNAFLIVTGILGCILFALQVTLLIFEVTAVLVHHGGSRPVWELSFHDLFAYPGDHSRGSLASRGPRDSDVESAGSIRKDAALSGKDVDIYDDKTPAKLLKHDYYDGFAHGAYAKDAGAKGEFYFDRKENLGAGAEATHDRRTVEKTIEAEQGLYAAYEQHRAPSYSSH